MVALSAVLKVDQRVVHSVGMLVDWRVDHWDRRMVVTWVASMAD